MKRLDNISRVNYPFHEFLLKINFDEFSRRPPIVELKIEFSIFNAIHRKCVN